MKKEKGFSTIEGVVRQNTDNSLPIIKLLKEEKELFYKWTLEMEPETRDIFVRHGRECVTDDELFEIGFRRCLEETLEKA